MLPWLPKNDLLQPSPVYSPLQHCITIWGLAADNALNPLEKLHIRIIRVCLFVCLNCLTLGDQQRAHFERSSVHYTSTSLPQFRSTQTKRYLSSLAVVTAVLFNPLSNHIFWHAFFPLQLFMRLCVIFSLCTSVNDVGAVDFEDWIVITHCPTMHGEDC